MKGQGLEFDNLFLTLWLCDSRNELYSAPKVLLMLWTCYLTGSLLKIQKFETSVGTLLICLFVTDYFWLHAAWVLENNSHYDSTLGSEGTQPLLYDHI